MNSKDIQPPEAPWGYDAVSEYFQVGRITWEIDCLAKGIGKRFYAFYGI